MENKLQSEEGQIRAAGASDMQLEAGSADGNEADTDMKDAASAGQDTRKSSSSKRGPSDDADSPATKKQKIDKEEKQREEKQPTLTVGEFISDLAQASSSVRKYMKEILDVLRDSAAIESSTTMEEIALLSDEFWRRREKAGDEIWNTAMFIVRDTAKAQVQAARARAAAEEKYGWSKLPRLTWREPHPLLGTLGASWDYQPPDDGQLREIAEYLQAHWGAWKIGEEDKREHCVFVMATGPGTGKSRFLSEFPGICLEAVKTFCPEGTEKKELVERLEQARVFNLTFENGTPLLLSDPVRQKKPQLEVGVRMLYQLMENQVSSYERLIDNEANHLLPGEVLEQLAEDEGREQRDLTFFINVDGIHHLGPETFVSFMRAMSIWLNKSAPFIVLCLSATIYAPVENAFGESSQCRMWLTPPTLRPPTENGEPVFDFRSEWWMQLLVDDMGGHPRALEILRNELNLDLKRHGDGSAKLSGSLVNSLDRSSSRLYRVAAAVRSKLSSRYPAWASKRGDFVSVMRCVMGSRRFDSREDLVAGTQWRVDQVAQFGLVYYDPAKRRLRAPYILLLLFSEANPSEFEFLSLYSYQELASIYAASIPSASSTWQGWELFNAGFRCLKSKLFEGNHPVQIRVLHSGARFGPDTESIQIWNQPLRFEEAKKQFPTQSSNPVKECRVRVKGPTGPNMPGTKIVSTSDAASFILSAASNTSGDGFCAVREIAPSGERRLVHEVHQYKYRKNTSEELKEGNVKEERKKAADPDDVFVFATNAVLPDDIELPQRTVLVYDRCWDEYYGPYVGRAYFIASLLNPE